MKSACSLRLLFPFFSNPLQHVLAQPVAQVEAFFYQAGEMRSHAAEVGLFFGEYQYAERPRQGQPPSRCDSASARLVHEHEICADLQSQRDGLAFTSIQPLPQEGYSGAIRHRPRLKPRGLAQRLCSCLMFGGRKNFASHGIRQDNFTEERRKQRHLTDARQGNQRTGVSYDHHDVEPSSARRAAVTCASSSSGVSVK